MKDIEQENTERYYVSNKALYDEMVKWRDSNKEEEDEVLKAGGKIDYAKRVISEELGRMIMEIATRLTSHTNFRNYSYDLKQEMISNAICKVIQGLKNYNFKYVNPFGYITRACWNANINVCIKHYKDKNLPRELVRDNLDQLDQMSSMDSSKIRQAIKEFLDYEPKTKDDDDYSSPIVTPPNPHAKQRKVDRRKMAAAKTSRRSAKNTEEEDEDQEE